MLLTLKSAHQTKRIFERWERTVTEGDPCASTVNLYPAGKYAPADGVSGSGMLHTHRNEMIIKRFNQSCSAACVGDPYKSFHMLQGRSRIGVVLSTRDPSGTSLSLNYVKAGLPFFSISEVKSDFRISSRV